MNSKNFLIIIIIIVIAVLLLVSSFLVGFYFSQKEPLKIGGTENIVKIVNSKVIPSIIANGIVTEISGRIITLSSNEESLDINIREDAKIYSLRDISGEINPTFEFIKVGDNLSINIKILSDGKIEGLSITIPPLPTSSGNNTP